VCGATGVVEDRWRTVSGFGESKVLETLGIRIHDPAKSDIPIEVVGPLNSQPACASEYRHIGVQSLEISFVDIASGEIMIEQKSRQGKDRVSVDLHRISGIRECSARPLDSRSREF
jgi:hypothetical protein